MPLTSDNPDAKNPGLSNREKAEKSLEIFLLRSEELLAAISSQDFDQVEDLLRKRLAAFHNFKTFDYLAEKFEPGYNSNKLRRILHKYMTVEPELRQALANSLEALGRRKAVLGRYRDRVSRFRSEMDRTSGKVWQSI